MLFIINFKVKTKISNSKVEVFMFKVRYFTHTIFEIPSLQLSFQIDSWIYQGQYYFYKKNLFKKKIRTNLFENIASLRVRILYNPF